MRRFTWNRLALAAAVVGLCGGCTSGYFYRIGPHSHFAYPNSNVKALGPVNVKTSGNASVFAPPSWMTSEIDLTMYNEGLSQVEGANMIVDYVRVTTLKQWPLLPIFWTEEQLEGTAARMEVGRRELE